ncbi:MAG TPA: SPOR domain-containing protein [Halothiobacillus sp.]|nr:SPOR domain-containing protein [Halothiobacillus sp.]
MAQTKRTPVNRRRSNEPNAASKWIVLLLIVAVALLAYVASQLWKKDAALGGHSAQHDARSVKKPEEKAPQKPDFEFYTLLPQQNNGPVIPTPAPPAPVIKPAPVEKPPASPGTVAPNAPPDAAPKPSERSFWIQAGSFATPAEANRRKAEIAMQGFVSDVRTATVNGKQYYRIQIGPIAESQLAGVRKRLVEARIDTLPPKTTP